MAPCHTINILQDRAVPVHTTLPLTLGATTLVSTFKNSTSPYRQATMAHTQHSGRASSSRVT